MVATMTEMNLLDYGFEELSNDELLAIVGGDDSLAKFITQLVMASAAGLYTGFTAGITTYNATGSLPTALIITSAAAITGYGTGFVLGGNVYNSVTQQTNAAQQTNKK